MKSFKIPLFPIENLPRFVLHGKCLFKTKFPKKFNLKKIL